MKTQDLRKKSLEDLEKDAKKLDQEIGDIYLEMRMGKQKDLREPRKMRKDLARLYTVMKEKDSNNLRKKADNGKDETKGKSNKK